MVQFNKMFIMLPVMLLARKLDAEDPTVVHWLRISYGVLQCVAAVLVLYVYLQANRVQRNAKLANQIIYVPPTPTPFADPNAKKKYTEMKYGAQVMSTARSLLTSTFFGMLMTVGLHYYKGMIVGLAMQTIMTPFSLAENSLVKVIFWNTVNLFRTPSSSKTNSSSTQDPSAPLFRLQDRVFDEKLASELNPDDEIVDEQGSVLVRAVGAAAAARVDTNVVQEIRKETLEEVLLDTWDAGNKADLGPLMKMLNKENINFQTRDDSWTPLMILSGLGAAGTASAIRQVREMGANPRLVDKEGWSALHWAAYHGSVVAAKELSNELELLTLKDKDGHTPAEMARKEKNDDVAEVYEAVMGESKKSK